MRQKTSSKRDSSKNQDTKASKADSSKRSSAREGKRDSKNKAHSGEQRSTYEVLISLELIRSNSRFTIERFGSSVIKLIKVHGPKRSL